MPKHRARSDLQNIAMRCWISHQDDARHPCTIVDISQAGATLAVDEPGTLPENIRLYFSPTAKTFRQCVVRSRGPGSVRIQFEKLKMKDVWMV